MELVIIDGISLEIQPLTRGQIRQLRDHGFSYFVCKPSLEQAHDAMDAAFDLALSDKEKALLDKLPVKESFKVWKAILAETYGGGDDEKNSNGTSAGGSIEKESNTADAAVPEKQR